MFAWLRAAVIMVPMFWGSRAVNYGLSSVSSPQADIRQRARLTRLARLRAFIKLIEFMWHRAEGQVRRLMKLSSAGRLLASRSVFWSRPRFLNLHGKAPSIQGIGASYGTIKRTLLRSSWLAFVRQGADRWCWRLASARPWFWQRASRNCTGMRLFRAGACLCSLVRASWWISFSSRFGISCPNG